MRDLLSQQIPPERRKEQEFYQQLTETLDLSIGLDDISLTRDGYSELLDDTRHLGVRSGEDGVYGHMISLRIGADSESPTRDDFFSINTFDSGTLEVIAARKGAESYLVTIDERGRVICGFPTDETDLSRRKIGSEKLSSEDARGLVEAVMNEFGHEYSRRLELLPSSSDEDD